MRPEGKKVLLVVASLCFVLFVMLCFAPLVSVGLAFPDLQLSDQASPVMIYLSRLCGTYALAMSGIILAASLSPRMPSKPFLRASGVSLFIFAFSIVYVIFSGKAEYLGMSKPAIVSSGGLCFILGLTLTLSKPAEVAQPLLVRPRDEAK